MPRGHSRTLQAKVASAGRILVAAAAVSVLLGCAQSTAEEDASAGDGPAQRTSDEYSTDDPIADPDTRAAEPAGLQIPSIDIAEDRMVDLDIMADGRLQEPSGWDDVGWFAGGPRPGQAGATVIAGHVDSAEGPAVFYRLLELTPGEDVTVVDAEGREHEYQVERVADFPKDDFPTREVFGAEPDDELRLITCTGEFDDAARRHADNRVVFASRVS